MKNIIFLLFSFLISLITFISCDTASDTGRALSTTPPSLLKPADRDTMVGAKPTFEWSGNADILQVSKSEQFTSLVINANVSGQAYTSTVNLENWNWYYWRAGITSGGVIYWSTKVFSFRVKY